jgi:uncharacterized repeat protein (TIGR03803 family)
MANLTRFAFSIGVVALFAGCGGPQLPIDAPGAMPQSVMPQSYENRSGHNTGIVETVIYSFVGGSGSMADGVNPRAGLINVSGTLYGTTFIGGFYNPRFVRHSYGIVFSTTPSGTETVLHRFTGHGDGKYPYARLLDVDGVMYGTTRGGGSGRDFGTVFSITPDGTETVLHRFKGLDGSGPQAGLVKVDGVLYGTTEAGGSSNCNGYGCGTVFKITPAGEETVLHRFGSNGDGVGPFAGLVKVRGTLYGTTAFGGAQDDGVVFAITPSGKESILHRFKGGASDGAEPWAGLTNVNGALYGTTFNGGANGNCNGEGGCGTVFSITRSGTETLLHSFGASGDGADPEAGLLNVNGILYGTTLSGGAKGDGTVFSITPSGTETVLYSFASKYHDGVAPEAGLINVNGTLYGTTVYGGTNDDGTVYSLTGI